MSRSRTILAFAMDWRMGMDREVQRLEVDRKYDAFQRSLGEYLNTHRDEYALLRHGEVVAFFGTVGAAHSAGIERFADEVFFIQEVTDQPIDLGFYSVAFD